MNNYLSWSATILDRINVSNLNWPNGSFDSTLASDGDEPNYNDSTIRSNSNENILIDIQNLSFRDYFDYLWHRRYSLYLKDKRKRWPNLKRYPVIPRATPNQYWQHHMGPIIWLWLHSTSLVVPLDQSIQFLTFIQELIECHICKGHFAQVVIHFKNTNTIKFDNVFVLSIFIHNLVNFRLGKEIIVDMKRLHHKYNFK